MIYRSFNIGLFLRLILLLCFSVGLGFAIAQNSIVWIILCSISTLISLPELLNKIASVNRKLTYFFDAVRNEDSTLNFPEKVQDYSTRRLHKSLNHLNSLISEIKIRNEHKERFYQELLTYSATGLIAVDEDGFIDLINKAALRILGMPQLGHIKLLEQKNKELFTELIQLEPGQTRTLKILQNEELQLISVKISLLSFGEKKFRVFSLYDIKTELEENEVDSWQKLIRVLTHEIMNSVAPITSLSSTLQRLLQTDMDCESNPEAGQQMDKAREGLSVIEETGKGLMHFIDNYRKLTKVPKPAFKTVIIKDWIKRIQLLLEEKLKEEHIELKISFKTNQEEFIADEKLLTQVLINLLNNAIDALAKSDKKIIVLLTSLDKTGKLQFSITDYGRGIPADELDKIFIPFYTTKENGNGVGLSLCRQIVRLHKGSISVKSEPGKTSFILKI